MRGRQMSPEEAFSPESKKLHKWLSKRIKDMEDQRDLIIYAGRERADSERPERCYVRVLSRDEYNTGITLYFDKKPSREGFTHLIKFAMKELT